MSDEANTTVEPTAPIQEPTPQTSEPTAAPAVVSEPAPVDYSTLVVPEALKADSAAFDALKAAAETGKVPLDVFQAQVNGLAASVAAHAEKVKADFDAEVEGWKQTIAKDVEIGGAKLQENLARLDKFLTRYGDDELKSALDTSGLKHFPPFVRAMVRVARDLGEAPVLQNGNRPPVDGHKVMYPNSPAMFQ